MSRTARVLDGLIEVGLIALVLGAALAFGGAVPWAEAAIEGDVGVLVALWAWRMVVDGEAAVRLTPLLWPGLAAVAIVAVQLARPDGSASRYATWESLRFLIACLAVLIVLQGHLVTRSRIVRFAGVLVGGGVIFALLQFANHVADPQRLLWLPKSVDAKRLTATFVNPNHQALYFAILMLLALGLLLRPRRRGHDLVAEERRLVGAVLLLGAIVAMGTALVMTLSRGALVSAILGLVVVVGLSLHDRLRTLTPWVLTATVLAFVGYAAWIGLDPLLERLAVVSREPFADLRWTVWQATLGLAGSAPLLGVGLGAYADAFPPFRPGQVPGEKLVDFAHNDYLQLLAEAGIVGILILVWALVGLATYILRRWTGRRDPFVRGLTIGLAGALVAALAHSAVDFGLHLPANALLLVVILALLPAVVTLKRHRTGERVDLAEWRWPLRVPGRVALGATATVAVAAWLGIVVPAAVAGWELRTASIAVGAAGPSQGGPTVRDLAEAERALTVAARWTPADPRVAAALATTSDDLARRVWSYGVTPDGQRVPASPPARLAASQALFGTALDAYETALRARPRAAEVWDRLGWFVGGLEQVRRAVREIPGPPVDARLTLLLRSPESLVPRALAAVQEAVRLDPNNPASYRSLGAFALGYVRGDEGLRIAADAFQRALLLQPGLVQVVVDDLVVRGADDDLIRASVPRQYTLVLALARDLDRRGRKALARGTFETAVDLAATPRQQVEARVAYARALLSDGQAEAALGQARHALAADAKEPEVFAVLAQVYEASQQWDAAESSLASAVRLAVTDRTARARDYRVHLASFLGRRGQGARAVALWRQVIAENPGDAWAHLELGRLLAAGHDGVGALHEYRTAQALGGDDWWLQRGVARGLVESGLLSEAVAPYEAAVRLEPDQGDLRTELAGLYARIGWRERAAEQYRRVLAQNPSDEAARRGLSQLEATRLQNAGF